MQVSTTGDASNGADPPHDPEVDDLVWDDLYHLLQHERRRHVVRALSGGVDPPTDVRSLVDRVASGERATAAGDAFEADHHRVYVDLVQSHLPKLARSGVVRYDLDAGRVAAGPTLPRLAAFLPEEVEVPADGSTETGDASGSDSVSPDAIAVVALVGAVVALAAVAVDAASIATAGAAGAGVFVGTVAALALSIVS